MVAREKLEEDLEAKEEELAKLRADARILKAGGAVERFAAPSIAYSPAMRALTGASWRSLRSTRRSC
ncbi:MAG: hypothetical protein M5U28_29575 [Sandaracinaceae bacterium]|nr:hypothetical protein [Sandaracinaceae bacterium]